MFKHLFDYANGNTGDVCVEVPNKTIYGPLASMTHLEHVPMNDVIDGSTADGSKLPVAG